MNTDTTLTLDYHQQTKHRFTGYARSPGYLDWDTQPDPFRTFGEEGLIRLPLAGLEPEARYADLFAPGRVSPAPDNPATLGLLLRLAFGLSAWKSVPGSRWSLRCNPSSGNLHPTEAYVVAGPGQAISPGVYHYRPYDHVLECRAEVELPLSGILIGLSSVFWREAWKYGERAFRYCQHDVGHALGALRMAAGVLGWGVRLLDDWGDDDIARLLGLDRTEDFGQAEREAPDLLCRVGPRLNGPLGIDAIIAALSAARWRGRANRLSQEHRHDWPIIDTVHAATHKPRTSPAPGRPGATTHPPITLGADTRAMDILLQRRSAQAFDGITAIPARALFQILAATLPGRPPCDVLPWPPRVNLVLFVHRVVGLTPGLYLFARHEGAAAALRQAMRAEFGWEPVEAADASPVLFRLVAANARTAAQRLSCHQDIAADGAFSLGMLAEFEPVLAEGAWHYRRLFWECGLIGQALYLAAEDAGVRGTGIGCYFDDAMHELLGLSDSRYQSLYHFTVGSPVEDSRLQTLPPYGHLER
jgi:SagB-type dehydrogenase family enzyme